MLHLNLSSSEHLLPAHKRRSSSIFWQSTIFSSNHKTVYISSSKYVKAHKLSCTNRMVEYVYKRIFEGKKNSACTIKPIVLPSIHL